MSDYIELDKLIIALFKAKWQTYFSKCIAGMRVQPGGGWGVFFLSGEEGEGWSFVFSRHLDRMEFEDFSSPDIHSTCTVHITFSNYTPFFNMA